MCEAYFFGKFFLLGKGLGRPQLLPQAGPSPFFRLLATIRQMKMAAVRAMITKVVHDCQLEGMGIAG